MLSGNLWEQRQDIEQARAAFDRARKCQTAEQDWQRAETLFRTEHIGVCA
jgi:multidrug resistance efflux pump